MIENQKDIDALPLNEWHTLRVGLLKTMPTDVIVISREDYVEMADGIIGEGGELPDDVAADLALTARTADRFALDTWIHETRGCGCLVGEYLVAQDAIREHNAEVDSRSRWADIALNIDTIETRLILQHGRETADMLLSIGQDMDDVMHDFLYEATGKFRVGNEATVFIRDAA